MGGRADPDRDCNEPASANSVTRFIVQNEDQRVGETFSIIPSIDSEEQPRDSGAGLSPVD